MNQNIDKWDLKLKIYHELKHKKAINQLLQIKVVSVPRAKQSIQSTRANTERTKQMTNRKDRYCTPPSTDRQIDTRILSPRAKSTQSCRTLKSSKVSQLKSPLSVSKICPINTQSPLQRYFNRYPIEDFERNAFQNFLYNHWVSEVITKKSVHIVVPKFTEQERQQRLQKFENIKEFRQVRFKGLRNPKVQKMERVLCKLKILCRLAQQRNTDVIQVQELLKDHRILLFFVHFRNEDFAKCDEMINTDKKIIDLPDYQGDRSLHICIRRNNLRQLNYLLKKSPDLEALNYSHITPLQLAININHHDCQKLLLVNGANPFYVSKPNSLTKAAVFQTIRLIQVSQHKAETEPYEDFKKRIYEDAEIDVCKEDQQKINLFSRLNMQQHDLFKSVAQKKDEIGRLSDGLDEMELMEEDEMIQYKFADSFFTVTVGKAKQLIELHAQQLKKSFEADIQKSEEVRKQMMNLKAKLYAKFGNQINLDDD